MSDFTVNVGNGKQVEVSVIKDSAKVRESISNLWSSMNNQKPYDYPNYKKVVGLCMKKTYSTNSSGQGISKIKLLVLCWGTKCLILHLNRINQFSIELANFLSLPHVIFVGVGIEKDLALLENDYGLQCTNFVALSSLVVVIEQKYLFNGLSEMASRCGLDLPKQSDAVLRCFQCHDLSEEAINYATCDAYGAFYVGNYLL
ncbi:hypothetical protein ACFE04_027355 [Oxalis oulophora]